MYRLYHLSDAVTRGLDTFQIPDRIPLWRL